MAMVFLQNVDNYIIYGTMETLVKQKRPFSIRENELTVS